MPRILVTNDDGVRSEGIYALADALRPLGDVVIVAPHVEASAIGHALTLRRPLRLETVRDGVYEVDGTPSDCVNIAVTKLYTTLPDLVVSGINKGFNLGDDITYSGTVAGAMEGALLGIASIAVSLARSRNGYDFGPSAAAAASVAALTLRNRLPPRTFLNINVPSGQPKGSRWTVRPSATTSRLSTSDAIHAARIITGSKKGRTTGNRTIDPTIRRCVTGSFPSRLSSPI